MSALASLVRKTVVPRTSHAQREPSVMRVLLITDPGPDPDDVKVLLVLAVLHRRGLLDFVGAVCNGGCQPEQRARLARCVLDTVGAREVPVAIGSMGKPYSAQPHEYAIAGFDAVDPARLLHGPTLIARALAESPAGSLTVLVISALTDLAEAIRADGALVRAKVARVSVMGGLERDATAPYGWAPDTSVNNVFDTDGARFVYDWCFEQGVPLAVVSRNVVPMLPMQLARSFAHRTNSDVMRYLADAQYLGLEGLWVKLCEGKLPARCSKRWFAETFCQSGEGSASAHAVEQLGADAPIQQHLNGFVKPYDVLALMAVLPKTRHLFASAASVRVLAADGRAVAHLLLLDAAHALDVRHVVRLLRDTYHAVMEETHAVVTTGGRGDAAARKDARLVRMASEQEQDARESVALADAVRAELELSLQLDDKAGAALERLSSGQTSIRASTVRVSAANRTLDAPNLAQQLADAAAADRRVARAHAIAAALLAAAVSVVFVAVVLAEVVVVGPGARPRLGSSRFWARALASCGLMAGVVCALALKPTDAHRRPARAVSAALALLGALGALCWLGQALALLDVARALGFEPARAPDAPPAARAALERARAAAYLVGAALLLGGAAAQAWAARGAVSASARLRALWWSLRVGALAVFELLLVDAASCSGGHAASRVDGCYADERDAALDAAHVAAHGVLLVLLAPQSGAAVARLFAQALRGRAAAPWLAPIAAFLGAGGRGAIAPLRASHDALLSFVAVELTVAVAASVALARQPLHLTSSEASRRSISVSVASRSLARRASSRDGAEPAAEPAAEPSRASARAARSLAAWLATGVGTVAAAPWSALLPRVRRTRLGRVAPHGDDDDDDDDGGADGGAGAGAAEGEPRDAMPASRGPSRQYAASARISMARSAASSSAGTFSIGGARSSAELSARDRELPPAAAAREAVLAARAAAIASASVAEPADYYVVHSPLDASAPRRAALVRFASAAAALNGGAPPTVWLDELCRDPGFTSRELLAHLPFHLCRARKLLLIVGPHFAYCLRSVCVLVAWRLGGGSVDDIEVCYAAEGERDLSLIVTSADVFHVTYARLAYSRALWAPLARVVERMRVPLFNETVRRCLSAMKPAPGAMGTRIDPGRVSALRAERSAAIHRSTNFSLSGSLLERFGARASSEATATSGAHASSGGAAGPEASSSAGRDVSVARRGSGRVAAVATSAQPPNGANHAAAANGGAANGGAANGGAANGGAANGGAANEPRAGAPSSSQTDHFMPWTSFFDGLFGKAIMGLPVSSPHDPPQPPPTRLARLSEQSGVSSNQPRAPSGPSGAGLGHVRPLSNTWAGF